MHWWCDSELSIAPCPDGANEVTLTGQCEARGKRPVAMDAGELWSGPWYLRFVPGMYAVWAVWAGCGWCVLKRGLEASS